MFWFKISQFSRPLTRSFSVKKFGKKLTPTVDDVSLCVVGNGAESNPRSLFLTYNESILMFNCGEGLQRALSCFGFKAAKIDGFFLTSNNWNNLSGLSSVLLSRFDSGVKEFNVNGCVNEDLIKQYLGFDVKLKRIKINYDLITKNGFSFDKLQIKPVSIPFGKNDTLVYLCEILPQKGLVDLDKCFQLKVPRNLVSALEEGSSISLEDGRTISPSDVHHPDQPHSKFVIFECLHHDYLKLLKSNPTINNFLCESECIVHFTSDKHLSQGEYRSFLESHPTAHHLLLTESNPSFSLYSAHRFQTQLNHLDSELFPLLKESECKSKTFGSNIVNCQAGLSYVLRPSSEEKLSVEKVYPVPSLEESLIHQDGTSRDGIEDEIVNLRKKQSALHYSSDQDYPEFIFLGTASSVSLPIRNVSAILVNLSESESILLDCGEGTYSQLIRYYGIENMKQVLKNLKTVFVSHHHSDHHLGLIQLIEKHHELTGQKLSVIIPPMVSSYLHLKSQHFPTLNDLRSKYNYTISAKFDQYKSSIVNSLNVADIALIPVDHCAFAYAILVITRSGYRFVYSGDTQPSENLIKATQDCDLLIHEATVEDNLVHFARANFHSTINEAIKVADTANVRFAMLTHFSQRYGKLPFVPDESHRQNIGLAFDFMRIKPRHLERIPPLYDALECMYAKHLDNLRYKSTVYSRKYNNQGSKFK